MWQGTAGVRSLRINHDAFTEGAPVKKRVGGGRPDSYSVGDAYSHPNPNPNPNPNFDPNPNPNPNPNFDPNPNPNPNPKSLSLALAVALTLTLTLTRWTTPTLGAPRRQT